MTCLIVDDNKMARTAMKQLASQVSGLTVAGECASAMEAYNVMQQQTIDLLFLDIEMPGMNGIELTRNLGSKRPVIIFTTSKKEYAVDAFELNVADYILKPVMPARFIQAVEKAKELYASQKINVNVEGNEFVFIRDNGVLRRLLISDIHYLEAMGDYVKVFVKEKFYTVHNTLKTIEEKLPPGKFLRVHRSYVVALNKIEKIEEGVIVINGKTIPVADAYRNMLNKKLNIL